MTDHTVFALTDIEPGTSRRVELDGKPIAVVRIDDDVYAIGDTCSHAEVSLSQGWVDSSTCEIECVRHGATFDVRTGEPTALPATRSVDVYHAEVKEGMVVVRTVPEEGRS